MTTATSLEDFVAEIEEREMVHLTLGAPLSKERLLDILLDGVVESLMETSDDIRDSEQEVTWDSAVARLNRKWSRLELRERRQEARTAQGRAFLAANRYTNSTANNGRRKNQRNQSNVQDDEREVHPNLKCFGCGGNHYKRNCPNRSSGAGANPDPCSLCLKAGRKLYTHTAETCGRRKE